MERLDWSDPNKNDENIDNLLDQFGFEIRATGIVNVENFLADRCVPEDLRHSLLERLQSWQSVLGSGAFKKMMKKRERAHLVDRKFFEEVMLDLLYIDTLLALAGSSGRADSTLIQVPEVVKNIKTRIHNRLRQ